jgi:stringent starvation protein B
VLLHIDARHPLAQVPEKFRRDPKLVLRFGYDLTPAIIDLSVDVEGMYGTLTFGGIPTRCVLPWGCIYSVVSEADQKGMVWPEDVPECVVDALQEQRDGARPPAKKERPEFGSVEAEDLESDRESGHRPPTSPPPTSPPAAPSPARGGHLKLVK